MRKLLFLLAVCAQLCSLSFAEVGEKADFSGLNNCTFYQGKVTPDDLKGKVVFVEYWGLQCPPCRAYMPKLQELYAKYKNQGFVVIATHCQMPNPPANNSFFKEHKLTFTSCEHFGVPQAPCPGRLPFSALIGSNGKVVAMGSPSEVEAKVEAEMKKVTGGAPILSDLNLTKYAKMQTTIVEGAPNIEAKIEALRSKSDDEAEQICAAYDSWLEARKSNIANQKDTDAIRFISQVNTLKKSVPSVTDFDKDVAKLMSDPAYAPVSEAVKKEKAMRKKLDDGKKVSPKAIANMRDGLDNIKPANDAFTGSIESLKEALTALEEQASSASPSKKEKADKKKR